MEAPGFVTMFLANLNASKILAGVASMTFNFGSRALIGEMTPRQQHIFQHPVVKRLVVLCMYFFMTRDIIVSVALSLITILGLEVLFNETSRFCVLPGTRGHRSAMTALPGALPSSLISKVTANRRQMTRAEDVVQDVGIVETWTAEPQHPPMVPLA
jgi:hypothetical protein